MLQTDTRRSNLNNVFTFDFYICILSCLNTIYPPCHHCNACIAICAFDHTYVELHVAGIQKILCRHL